MELLLLWINVELGKVVHGTLLRDNKGISDEGNFNINVYDYYESAIKGSFLFSYYLIDLFVRLVVGLKEIFIENIGFLLWGEIILLSVIDELRDGVVDLSPSWKF